MSADAFLTRDPTQLGGPSLIDRLIRLGSRAGSVVPNAISQKEIFGAVLFGTCIPAIWLLRRWATSTKILNDRSGRKASEAIEPDFLKSHSKHGDFSVEMMPGFGDQPDSKFLYRGIRVFYRDHPQMANLDAYERPLPLLAFVHGLGGCVGNWLPILESLKDIAPCLAIDLPGCGESAGPMEWFPYQAQHLARLVEKIIRCHIHTGKHQQVVLIGHSMGSSICGLLASRLSTHHSNFSREVVIGVVGICPKSLTPDGSEADKIKQLTGIPDTVLDILRKVDRWGGIESKSVKRFTGDRADKETRQLQLTFNRRSLTPVFKRMARGFLYTGRQSASVWEGVEVPVFLIAGEDDHVTSASELGKIASILGWAHDGVPVSTLAQPSTAMFQKPSKDTIQKPNNDLAQVNSGHPSHRPKFSRPTLKATILPSPAAHSLLFAPTSARVVSGLIQQFLSDHVDKGLSRGWQLQHLNTGGKWDVKNLQKWQATEAVSRPIGGMFRALKTLREVDEIHCPKRFVLDWSVEARGKGNDGIFAVVDLSHDDPVYDSAGLEAGGVQYHKLSTVSKLPPEEEVLQFRRLVDKLRGLDPDDPGPKKPQSDGGHDLIGVHCHYGFNRTGYLVICYLVDRLGWELEEAIDEFRVKRPNGIRHSHFIDQLYVRYFQTKRASTLIGENEDVSSPTSS